MRVVARFLLGGVALCGKLIFDEMIVGNVCDVGFSGQVQFGQLSDEDQKNVRGLQENRNAVIAQT